MVLDQDEPLDHVRGHDDRADRDVPARAVHRPRHLGALVEQPHPEGAGGQGSLLHLGRAAARLRHWCDSRAGTGPRGEPPPPEPARHDRHFQVEGAGLYFQGDIVPSNPFPDEWVLTPTQGKYTPIIGKRICNAHYPGVAPCPTKGIGDSGGVQWGSTITKHVLTVAKVISLVFLIAVILLVIAATLLIANTIRLSIFARRREIEVMKLVGATNWFIRGPFVLEGLVCGLVGSIFAVILLVLGKTIALPAVIGHLGGDNSDIHAMPFTLNALLIMAVGLLLGAMGSGLTLRRFLQV
ncbi:MAG: FtsX-like permease family protein [Actinobacteria bacterium]|nr:MAG: FtsX-like permease family protein [Actinomycetota bacterium]